jgi:molybdopterin-guanine dinucleotide biosynthesis protein A
MPFITRALLVKMLKRFHQPSTTALFSSENNHVGFPFLLRREAALPVVIEQIQTGDYSLQSFAKKLRAKTFRASKRHLANINTPAELAKAAWRVRQKK